jgi:myo-inositol-1(or 4)-monophosphatase
VTASLELAEHLNAALAAVELAEKIFLSTSPVGVIPKGERDMVSSADLEIERAVGEFLAERTPGTGFLGEEGGLTGPATESGLQWVLDPVDGTANFVRGLPLCAISLGLLAGDRAIGGVVSLPRLGLRYWGSEGGGAFRNGEPIGPSTTSRLDSAIVAVGDFAVGPDAQARNVRRLAVLAALAPRLQRVRMLGAAVVDLVWVADGRLDACVMLSNKPWDTAAGVAIARAAGAEVTDVDGREHSAASVTTVASTPAVAAALRAVVQA